MRTKKLASGVKIVEIPDYKGYWVSKCGRVFSTRSGTTPKELKTHRSTRGYPRISIRKEGVKVADRFYIHYLVLRVFEGPRPEGCVVRHLNHDKTDNRIENLEWGTPQDNADDNGLNQKMHGSDHTHTCLTEQDVVRLRERHANGDSYSTLLEDYPIAKSTLSYIINRKTWQHV